MSSAWAGLLELALGRGTAVAPVSLTGGFDESAPA